jgi:hypothetical protein
MEKIMLNIMKTYKHLVLILSSVILLSACSEDDSSTAPGNPVIESGSEFNGALFGDSLPFTIGVRDEIPLSTLTAKLYFGEEIVSETQIRTKSNGDYPGKIFIPYLADIPNGNATLEFVLKNTHLTTVTKQYELPVSRPDFPYLILVTDNAAYPMERTGLHQYAATASFPSADLPAYIKAPPMGEAGNEITFGWEDGAITQGSRSEIPFANAGGGKYTVTFNTLTYEAGPFFEIFMNGQKMLMADKTAFSADLDLTQGQEITVSGIEGLAGWWIDPDYLIRTADDTFSFVPVSGKYRITANLQLRYFNVEILSGNDLATLQEDGSGAVWAIGDGNIGKPSFTANGINWTTEKGLCLAPLGNKRYRLTLVAGEQISATEINFKFFYQRGWGGEFTDNITTTSDIVFVGTGGDSGRDAGNLGLVAGTTLEPGATYVFTLDVSAGINQAVLEVTKN